MQVEPTRERLDFLEKDFCRGFIKFCGFQVVKAAKGIFISTVEIGEHHKTQDNFIHAGLIATMSDHTAGYAAYTLVPDNIRILSIEFKINFLKPAYGNTLRCNSETISRGKQIIVAQSTVFDIRDTHEKMVSRSTITMMAVDAAKLGTAALYLIHSSNNTLVVGDSRKSLMPLKIKEDGSFFRIKK